ncbi:hypothetical protein QCA50_020764 [Cerrena zonata]|uniref:C2H2-type domain-containing protein n=1 Tax=Cerrena zonata TaxID=2478898 RepID=A0AAW0FFE7_9APHY
MTSKFEQLLRAAEELSRQKQNEANAPVPTPAPTAPTAPAGLARSTRRGGAKRKRNDEDDFDAGNQEPDTNNQRQLRTRRKKQKTQPEPEPEPKPKPKPKPKTKTKTKTEPKWPRSWCNICKKGGFGRHHEASRHEAAQHDVSRRFWCYHKTCNITWTSEHYHNYKTHLKNKHKEDFKDMCGACGYTWGPNAVNQTEPHRCEPPTPILEAPRPGIIPKLPPHLAASLRLETTVQTTKNTAAKKTNIPKAASKGKGKGKANIPVEEPERPSTPVSDTSLETPSLSSAGAGPSTDRSTRSSDSGYISGYGALTPSTTLYPSPGPSSFPSLPSFPPFHSFRPEPYSGQLRTANWAPEQERYYHSSYNDYDDGDNESEDAHDVDVGRPANYGTRWSGETPSYYDPSPAHTASGYSYPYPYSYASRGEHGYTSSLASTYSYNPAGPSSSSAPSSSSYRESTRYREPCSCSCDHHGSDYNRGEDHDDRDRNDGPRYNDPRYDDPRYGGPGYDRR